MKLYDCLRCGEVDISNFNCAEKILYCADRAYGLGLPPQALKLAAGFGMGMGVCYTCGTVSAGVMVLSHLFVKEYAHEGNRIAKLTGELIRCVEKRLGTVDCAQLRRRYRTKEAGCNYIIYEVAKALDDIVGRELAEEGKAI